MWHPPLSNVRAREVPSYDVWHRVWDSSFCNLRVRVHRSVDSKDKVRAWLRQALRDKKHYNKHDREYLTNLRVLYADSIRRERQFYWEARMLPGAQPLLDLCYIQDGATQSDYALPRLVGTDHGRAGVKVKLVGNLFHAHLLVLHIVHPQVPDDANLFCHCFDTSMEELIKTRIAKDQPECAPMSNPFPHSTPHARGET